MDTEGLIILAVQALAAVSVGMVVYIFVFPMMSGQRKTEKRVESVARGRTSRNMRNGQSTEELANRRKQVQENLKELEKRQKAKNNVTMRTRFLRAGLDITTKQFAIGSAVLAIVVAAIAFVGGANPWVTAMLAFAAGLGMPRWFLHIQAKRRQAKFLNEFANAIDVIVRGVKTGLPLNECLEIIARESPSPIREEFAELIEQQRVGVPLMECFDRMMDRMPVPEVNFFAIVISIQQQAGGNLAEALGNLSGVLRGRKMLAAKVKALSAEAKASAAILAGLPFFVVTAVYFSSPDYISLLWKDPLGHKQLAFSGVWMFLGIMVMRKMINFKY